MVAQMEGLEQDVLYYENTEGGHGGAANNRQSAFMSALAYTFLWNALPRRYTIALPWLSRGRWWRHAVP
jgi:prolyl oligopeptidase